MIFFLYGVVLYMILDQVVIDVGGVGFLVVVFVDVVYMVIVGERMFLYMSLIVWEDVLLFFGFVDCVELEIFGLLISVIGVGFKLVLGVFLYLMVDQIVEVVIFEDDVFFCWVFGIGFKMVKLIVVQFVGKVQVLVVLLKLVVVGVGDVVFQVVVVFVGFGWFEKVVVDVVVQIVVDVIEVEGVLVVLFLCCIFVLFGLVQGGQVCV